MAAQLTPSELNCVNTLVSMAHEVPGVHARGSAPQYFPSTCETLSEVESDLNGAQALFSMAHPPVLTECQRLETEDGRRFQLELHHRDRTQSPEPIDSHSEAVLTRNASRHSQGFPSQRGSQNSQGNLTTEGSTTAEGSSRTVTPQPRPGCSGDNLRKRPNEDKDDDDDNHLCLPGSGPGPAPRRQKTKTDSARPQPQPASSSQKGGQTAQASSTNIPWDPPEGEAERLQVVVTALRYRPRRASDEFKASIAPKSSPKTESRKRRTVTCQQKISATGEPQPQPSQQDNHTTQASSTTRKWHVEAGPSGSQELITAFSTPTFRHGNPQDHVGASPPQVSTPAHASSRAREPPKQARQATLCWVVEQAENNTCTPPNLNSRTSNSGFTTHPQFGQVWSSHEDGPEDYQTSSSRPNFPRPANSLISPSPNPNPTLSLPHRPHPLGSTSLAQSYTEPAPEPDTLITKPTTHVPGAAALVTKSLPGGGTGPKHVVDGLDIRDGDGFKTILGRSQIQPPPQTWDAEKEELSQVGPVGGSGRARRGGGARWERAS